METTGKGALLVTKDQAAERMESVLAEDGRTVEEFWSDAIGRLLVVEEIRNAGGRLLVEKGGHVKELVPS